VDRTETGRPRTRAASTGRWTRPGRDRARISRVLFSPKRAGSFLWDRRRRRPRAAYPGLGRGGHPSSLRGLAPGGVCRAVAVAGHPVRSYRTLSPLPVPRGAIGGLLSVALAVTLRRAGGRPGVTRHPALRSSDFPPTAPPPEGHGPPAILTARLRETPGRPSGIRGGRTSVRRLSLPAVRRARPFRMPTAMTSTRPTVRDPDAERHPG